MVTIGIDTHKATLAACAVDALGAPVDERTFSNDPAGHAALAGWVRAVGAERVGVEGSSSFGAAAARHLAASGADVREVPPHLSRRERIRTRRAGKSDPGDALAIARVTAREPDLPPVHLADRSTDLKLLVTARDELVGDATRVRNQVHADLVVLVPGYGGTVANLVAERHRRVIGRQLRRLPGVHAELARGRLTRLARLTAEIRALEQRIAGLVDNHPLRELPGAGPLTVAKLVAETGDVSRFRSGDAFAMLAGVAPIPASSGRLQQHRLNRRGNRQLNRALHGIALVQARHHAPAKAYIARKREAGMSWRNALRALKRHIARAVFRILRGTPTQQLQAA